MLGLLDLLIGLVENKKTEKIMKRVIIYAAVLLAISCQQTIDPFEKKFSCLLTKQVTSDNQTTTYQYDASDRLIAVIFSDNSKTTYTYGTNGKLQVSSNFNSSGAFQQSSEPTYSSDGKVAKVVYKTSTGAIFGEERFSYLSTSIKLDYFANGVSNAFQEYTLNGANVTRYFAKSTDATGKTVGTYEELYSDFQSGINPFYLAIYKIPGYPFSEPYNAYKTIKSTNINFVNGIAQSPSISTCTYTYTYNKSNATLTRASSCSNNGAAPTSFQRTFTYAKCD